jgi:SNF2 family DNA or RNA helicase
MSHWAREFAAWAPNLRVVMYSGKRASARAGRGVERRVGTGSKDERDLIYQHEWFRNPSTLPSTAKARFHAERGGGGGGGGGSSKKSRRPKFDVLLTSYELVMKDTANLSPINWDLIIVDEGHRLKGSEGKMFKTLTGFRAIQRVLLTGTPLQNNMDELFSLLNFLDQGKFHDRETFIADYGSLSQLNSERVAALQGELKPHMLRRLKKVRRRAAVPRVRALRVLLADWRAHARACLCVCVWGGGGSRRTQSCQSRPRKS